MPEISLRPPVPNFTLDETAINQSISDIGTGKGALTVDANRDGASVLVAAKVNRVWTVSTYGRSSWDGNWTAGARVTARW